MDCVSKTGYRDECCCDNCGLSYGDIRAEVERLREALADAIRCPMGVVPDSAEGLLTQADMDAAETRREKMK